MHHAAQVRVSTSIRDPLTDAATNVAGSIQLAGSPARTVGFARSYNASSAAIYGDPERIPVRGNDPARPISPYGVRSSLWSSTCTSTKLCMVSVHHIAVFKRVWAKTGLAWGRGVVAIFNDQITHGRPCTIFWGWGTDTRFCLCQGCSTGESTYDRQRRRRSL